MSTTLDKKTYIQTYHASKAGVSGMLDKNPIDKHTVPVRPGRPLVAYRKDKSLKDLLVRAEIPSHI